MTEAEREELICECSHVTAGEVVDAVLKGAMNFVDVQEMTGVGKGCDRCRIPIEFLINDVKDDPETFC